MPSELLSDLGIIFFVAIATVVALARVGLPPVVGFLVAGIFVGPSGFALVEDVHRVEILAEIGVALLLFTIGLEFSLARLARIGWFVVVGGGLQVLLTVSAAIAFAVAFEADVLTGVFWGYLAAVSSTAIVLRLLADRGETAAPHGRFIVGVLIFQDLCIVPMMLSLPMLAGRGGGGWEIGRTLLLAAVIVGATLLAARLVVPPTLRAVVATRRRELFLLSVLFIAVGVAWITSELGLSIALGAFLGGVVVADTEYVHQALSEVAPFRDTFASLFFVSIGMLLPLSSVSAEPLLVFGLVALLLVGKLVAATLAALLMRFPARVALLAGAGLAQVGEFSFVLLRAGQELGLAEPVTAGRFLAASVMTMMAAPLIVAASPRMAAGARLLRPLERMLAVRDFVEPDSAERVRMRDHVIIAGLGLGGRLVMRSLAAAQVPYVALDLNPETIITLRREGYDVRFGDASSHEVLEHVADAEHARMLVLLLSDSDASLRAAAMAQQQFSDLRVLVRAQRSAQDEADLHRLGVEIVSEDYETALEVTERVLRGSGIGGELLKELIQSIRNTRAPGGERVVSAPRLFAAIAMETIRLEPGDRPIGRRIVDAGLRKATGAVIVAIVRGEEVIASPPADLVLAPGDVLFVVGTGQQVTAATGWVHRDPAAEPAG